MSILLQNLLRVAKRFVGALAKNPSLPVTHISPATLTGSLKIAKKKRATHITAVRATRVALTQQKNVREAAIVYATTCRDCLTPALGRAWSNAWIPAGWPTSLSIPRSLAGLESLFEDLHQFLLSNSRVENAENHFTAEEVQNWLERLEAAESGVSGARTAQRQAKTGRTTAEAALLDEARGLVSELELILPENDERWIDFLSEVPGDEQRPEPVDVVVLTGAGAGVLDVDWDASARAERYLLYIKVIGVDADFRHVMTVRDANATLTGLPPGAEVIVRVIAANGAGEATPSEDETAKVPTLSVAA